MRSVTPLGLWRNRSPLTSRSNLRKYRGRAWHYDRIGGQRSKANEHGVLFAIIVVTRTAYSCRSVIPWATAMRKISTVKTHEILDYPTVRVRLTLDDGTRVSSSVPSGASTGQHEAVELRDKDKGRYGGKGVLKVVANINDRIAPELIGRDPSRQAEIDAMLIDLDGTPN
jgi:hypothetical protein